MAILSMALFRLPLLLNRACTFWKLLGSGKNGTFDLKPDLQQWGLLAVWKSKEDFESFLKSSFMMTYWRIFSAEQYTILCVPVASHGTWDGKKPFETGLSTETTGVVAVLTRATIRLKKVSSFWQNVGSVASLMNSAPGYLTSFGIGEAPFYRQATFSVWESMEDMKAFAYGTKEHAEVIKKTRTQDWYREELFARFKPLATFGTINGADPLKGKL